MSTKVDDGRGGVGWQAQTPFGPDLMLVRLTPKQSLKVPPGRHRRLVGVVCCRVLVRFADLGTPPYDIKRCRRLIYQMLVTDMINHVPTTGTSGFSGRFTPSGNPPYWADRTGAPKKSPPLKKRRASYLCTHLRTAPERLSGQPAPVGLPCNTHKDLRTAATFRS